MAQTIAKRYANSFIVVPSPSERAQYARSLYQKLHRNRRRIRRRRRRLAMRYLTAGERRKNALHQSACRIGAQFNRRPIAAALAFIGEVDGQHVIQRGMIRMAEI